MKWLSAGLTFVNFATICGLLLGMICRGLGPSSALASLSVGAAAAILAYLRTSDPPPKSDVLDSTEGEAGPGKYSDVWKWILAACFTVFAVRSFCWLLYIDGEQLKIQSPNNLGDLALHITYIRNFANGVPLWPQNPIYVFSNLRYPVGADLFNALLCLRDVDLIRGFVWVGLLGSAATFYAFYRWAGSFGVAGFLFNGGIIGFQFFNRSTLFKFLDYQGDKTIAWKSIALSMFVTQRGLLYAIPAGLLLLWHWREKYFRTAAQHRNGGPLPFWVELSLYASMPLFHVHTFLALTIVLIFLFALECLSEGKFVADLVQKEGIRGIGSLVLRGQWSDAFGDLYRRKHIAALTGSALIPATFFVWLITDHFRASSVLAWYPGWVLHEKFNNDFARPFLEFWFVNFGLWLPLLALLLFLCGWRLWKTGFRPDQKLSEAIAFLLPAVAIFVLAVLVKTAPWEWDNLKIMIWAYFLALPFLWSNLIARWDVLMRAAICITLFASGFISLFGGLAAGRTGFGFADRGELDGIGLAVQKLPVEARFAAYPTYNHPLLLQGRKLVLGYPGHLWTQGFDNYPIAEKKLRDLMEGTQNWREIARNLRVRYIFWGREEKLNYPTSTRPWEQAVALVRSGDWGAIYDLQQRQTPGGYHGVD